MGTSIPELDHTLRTLYGSGLVISPWLAGVDNRDRFDSGVFERLDLEARELAATHWTEAEKIDNFGTLPIPEKFPRIATYETVASTAVFLAHERTGDLLVNEGLALEALRRVENFISAHGFGTLLQAYRFITAYENLNALKYYGSIPEREFLLGSWHRPWIDYTLHDDLLIGGLLDRWQIVIRDNRRHVELTEQGHKTYEELQEVLERSGHFIRQVRLLQISQFNLFTDFENLAEQLLPQSMPLRRFLIDWSCIEQGMKVLDVGCGSGALTIEAGLADRVGPTGKMIGIDPSTGMLNRAKSKLQLKQMPWVEFMVGKAEELPFEDGAFDVVIGSAFLHFTNREAALKEMRRVTRSGGTVVSWHPLIFDFHIPFFHKWFFPIFKFAAKREKQPKSFLFTAEEGLAAFETAGLVGIESKHPPFPMLFHDPEKVIKHMINGVGLFQEELGDLPWKARQDIINELHDLGHLVCKEYPPEERIIYLPNQMLKGIVP